MTSTPPSDARAKPATWSQFLAAYDPLVDSQFTARWCDEAWQPGDDDSRAAAKLHMQADSRIATQQLGYLDGVEKSALDSIYALFELTRKICDEYPLARHFDRLAWHVLNTRVRPFTAKWHRESERGALRGLDTTDEFRAELSALQPVLLRFSDLLLHLRDGDPPPPRPPERDSDRETSIKNEMDGQLPWGIPSPLGGIDAATATAMNAAELSAIWARREHYSLNTDKPHAVALALSGGGIRSATFALGVLVALARRGILPQFDYLSTVSGGGYIGSFLTSFLNSPAPGIGLRADELPFHRDQGEANALRHIRHHGKYLAAGSLWGRVKMIFAQLYGMLLNGLGIVFLCAAAVLIERFLRWLPLLEGIWKPVTIGVAVLLVAIGLVSPRLLRANARRREWVDTALASVALLLMALLAWKGLAFSHSLLGRGLSGRLHLDKQTLLVILGGIPVVASAFPSLTGKLFKRTGVFLVLLAAIAAPLFFFLLYLTIYHWSQHPAVILGQGITRLHALIVVTVILAAVNFWLLNINFTSPHRHYRNKLAEAYVIQPTGDSGTNNPVTLPLSRIGTAVTRGPYHLLNGALNVPGSRNPAMQGRLTDFFLFSPAYCGSPLTGYQQTRDWEAADAHLDLGTAMAISGAAAAPQMGLGTQKNMSFWLALLNIRLGYWLRIPNKSARRFGGSPGLWYLLKEMLGTMDEKLPWLNVSDGGHIENLAVYELLRRRCKFIVAVDGEQDERMTFAGLTTLQRLAKIDLGVTIDIDLDDLRIDDKGFSRSHFRFCRVTYPGGLTGYLLYVKLSLTGNEGEFLRRYRLDEPAFPHHSTNDQFFSETQFEAYRSLGEHVGDKLFLPALVGDKLARSESVEVEEWFGELGRRLLDPRRDHAG
ncbi:MAG: patatin-like phospholipase family protein [Verrucomicrobiota bacterium]